MRSGSLAQRWYYRRGGFPTASFCRACISEINGSCDRPPSLDSVKVGPNPEVMYVYCGFSVLAQHTGEALNDNVSMGFPCGLYHDVHCRVCYSGQCPVTQEGANPDPRSVAVMPTYMNNYRYRLPLLVPVHYKANKQP